MSTITINDNDYHSYATVSEANEYFAASFNTLWANIGENDKQKLLITSTRLIDTMEYQGHKVSEEQPLKFPRWVCCEENVSSDDLLIQACCEVAIAVYKSSLMSTEIVVPNADKIKSMSVGDTSVSFQDGAIIETDFNMAIGKPVMKKYLKDWLKGNMRVIL